MARLGYGARGLVYVLVGIFALLAAIGMGGQTGGSRSALGHLLDQPFGAVLVGILALGLLCFAAWRLVEAATDADGRGSEPKGSLIRGAHALSGAIYAGLALTAAGMALGRSSGGGNEDKAARDWTAWLFTQPLGRWLVGGIALAIVGTGLAFAWKAYRGRVLDRLDVPAEHRDWTALVGRAGYGARGLVFVLVGAFLAGAAWHSRSAEVKGIGGALRSPAGPALWLDPACAHGRGPCVFRRVRPRPGALPPPACTACRRPSRVGCLRQRSHAADSQAAPSRGTERRRSRLKSHINREFNTMRITLLALAAATCIGTALPVAAQSIEVGPGGFGVDLRGPRARERFRASGDAARVPSRASLG
ncbi:DUF1206 domain-containing protein [Micromonospora sp. STR1s_5]|nr:DUF1206 domain-containing protein [Micromonospora sp. STR1s_5]